MANTKIDKPSVGLEKLTMWEVIDDSETTTYGEAHAFYKKLMTASDAPSVSEALLEADNQIVDQSIENSGGELSIGITALSSEERVLLYGETADSGTNTSHKDNRGKHVAVAYMTNRSDGKVNLYKFLKAMFMPQAETYGTKKSGSQEYATTNIKGTYIPTVASGDIARKRLGADPATEADVIENWFTDATYYKPEG